MTSAAHANYKFDNTSYSIANLNEHIEQVDLGSKTSYSEIRKIYLNESKRVVKVYPNRHSNILLLYFESFDKMKVLKVYDSSGQLILTKKVSNHTRSTDMS